MHSSNKYNVYHIFYFLREIKKEEKREERFNDVSYDMIRINELMKIK